MILGMIQFHTGKKVVGIDASSVCFKSSSVGYLTWTIDGTNAEKILET